MEKYDIAVDARMLHASGIGTYLQHILPAICSAYNTVLLGDVQQLKGYKAKVIPFEAPIYSVREIIVLPRLIPPCRVFWSPHFNVPLSTGKAEVLITTIHDVFHLAFYRTLSLKQKMYARLFYNLAVRKSSRVITVSEFSKRELLRYVQNTPEKIQVIHNGVTQQEFAKPYTLSEADSIRAKYSLPNDYLLYVGNVKPHKNLVKLVTALENMPQTDKELYLVIVGKKDGFITGDNQLSALLDASPLLRRRIVFTGFVAGEDLPFIYQQARLFLFPSLYEGFGLPPLEAMAAGTLTLASNLASIPEICQDGALYFDPNDENSIRETIVHALQLSATALDAQKQTAKSVANKYTWEASIRKHISLFNEYLSSANH
jgi:glycosyltransferase involved in cell wall biosynthesis